MGDVGWTSLERAFAGCSNLTSISGGVLSSVTSMERAFNYVPFVTGNVQGWDTSRVTNMSRMIAHNDPIRTILHAYGNPDLSRLDTKNVTNMNSMFFGNTGINPDIRNWNFSKVTNIYRMFQGAISANPNFEGKNLGAIENGTSGVNSIFIGADAFESANYSAFLMSLRRTNSGYNVYIFVDRGLGATLTPEARQARNYLIEDGARRWSIFD